MQIAISGKMCSGKTSASEFLVQNYGFTRISFATPMKDLEQIHRTFYNNQSLWRSSIHAYAERLVYYEHGSASLVFEVEDFILRLFKQTPYSETKNRELLQGLHFLRDIVGENVWINYLLKDCSVFHEDTLHVVNDDLRMLSEFEALKGAGFVTIRLQVNPEMQKVRIKQLYGEVSPEKMILRLSHPSETGLDKHEGKFDYLLDGNISLEEMYKNIQQIFLASN